MKTSISQKGLIREMGANEIIEYASKLQAGEDYQKLMNKCIDCYKQLTGKNLLNELNELNKNA